MDASVPIISLSFRQTTLRQACNNVRCSLPRQTGNAFPAGNSIKHKTRKATSKSSCCRLSYSGTASYIFPAVFCGKRGIRTPGASQLNGFQDRRNRPLCHLSGRKSITEFSFFQFSPRFTLRTAESRRSDSRNESGRLSPSKVYFFDIKHFCYICKK